jgi:hypothetical protein
MWVSAQASQPAVPNVAQAVRHSPYIVGNVFINMKEGLSGEPTNNQRRVLGASWSDFYIRRHLPPGRGEIENQRKSFEICGKEWCARRDSNSRPSGS